MNIINDHLKNPENKLILTSDEYPRGLTEKRVHDYWMTNRDKIVKWISGRQVSFLINTGNEKVLKRNHNDRFINLTDANYEQWMHGRVNAVYVTQTQKTDYVVVDIDGSENTKFGQVVEAMKFAKNMLKNMHIKRFEHLFSSKKGIHLICYFDKTFDIDVMKEDFINILSNQKKYKVNVKGRERGINYDMSPNVDKGLHVCRYSLTKHYLICDDILTTTIAGSTI